MKRTTYLSLVIACSLLGILIPSAHAQDVAASTSPVTISAQFLTRDGEHHTVHARENVKVTNKNMILTADDVLYFQDERKVNAAGSVVVRRDQQVMHGTALEYFFDIDKGTMQNGKAFYAPWIAQGKMMQQISKEKMMLKNGYFTSCDYDNPHYMFRAKKITVYPEKRLIAYHVILMFRGIPVLYLPILYQSLRDPHMEYDLVSGYNRDDGYYTKIRIMYPFTKRDKVKLYFDNYTERDKGYGLQYDYKREKREGSAFGYYIKDKKTAVVSTNFFMWHRETLSKYLNASLNIQNQNTQFNERERTANTPSNITAVNGNFVNTNIRSYLSFNYSREKYYWNATYEKELLWDTTAQRFNTTKETIPAFTFATYTNQIGTMPLYYKYILNMQNAYDTTRQNYYGRGDTSLSLSSKWSPLKFLTLTPLVRVNETYSNNTVTDTFHETYYTALNMRTAMGDNIDMDLTHEFEQLLIKRPRTISRNLLSMTSTIRPFRKCTIITGTSYDVNMRNPLDERQRFSALATEVRYYPHRYITFIGNHSYNLYTTWTSELKGLFRVGVGSKWYLQEMVQYVPITDPNLDPHIIDTITTAKWSITDKWDVAASVRTDYNYKIHLFSEDVKAYEFNCTRDLHCWKVQATWKMLKNTQNIGVEEVWFLVNIKSLPGQKLRIFRNVTENTDWHAEGAN